MDPPPPFVQSSGNCKFHGDIVIEHQRYLDELLAREDKVVILSGQCLSLAEILAISHFGLNTTIEPEVYDALPHSREALQRQQRFWLNSKSRGSAGARSNDARVSQRDVRELYYGVLSRVRRDVRAKHVNVSNQHRFASTTEYPDTAWYMPRSWIRAAILLRIDSLLQRNGGVRSVVINRMQDLLNHKITPMIPLRASISASGDLSPLSYVCGAIQGKRTVRVYLLDGVANAHSAFANAGLSPVTLEAEEGLAIVDETAMSTAAMALLLNDVHHFAVLAQIVAAMSAEALAGSVESFDSLHSEMQPCAGQGDSAANILAFLSGSKLVRKKEGVKPPLRQDRFSIRTASQCIDPILEDLVQVHHQIFTEDYSATGNPFLSSDGIYPHRNSFQGKTIISAMDKMRINLEAIGRMLFSQCTEMINPATSRGLPPDLVVEGPSLSQFFKGTNITLAALLAELGYLAHPMNHVQTSDMGDQALNSLALISARYTATSVDVLSQMLAYHITALCQALDLRAMQILFLETYQPTFESLALALCSNTQKRPAEAQVRKLVSKLWNAFQDAWNGSVSMDLARRGSHVARSLRQTFLDHADLIERPAAISLIDKFVRGLVSSLEEAWIRHRDAYLDHGRMENLLGMASRQVYGFVRDELQVPMLSTKRTLAAPGSQAIDQDSSTLPTVGVFKSAVSRAIKDGTMFKLAAEILRQARS